METTQFVILHLNNLTIDDLFSLNKSTIECATPVKESLGELPKAILAQLETNNNAMGNQMNKASKSALTAQLAGIDTDRDDRFAEIKRNVTTAIRGRDAVKKEAAQQFEIFLSPYWNTASKAMNTETGVFSELFEKFNANEGLNANAATIGITDMMTGLETSNTEFNTVYQTRNAQEAATDGPSASSLKSDALKSYDQFCMAVEQAANFTPSDILTSLFNQMDEFRKKYAVLVN